MTSSAQPTSTGWKVTGQRQTRQLLPGNQNFTDGYDVTFVTGANVTATVFVPVAQYNAAGITAAINERAAALDVASSLTVPPAS